MAVTGAGRERARDRVRGTRKTCASLLAALDVRPRVTRQILRHSKIAVTMEIYTEVRSAATRDALRKLGRAQRHVSRPMTDTAEACGTATARTSVAGVARRRRHRGHGRLVLLAG